MPRVAGADPGTSSLDLLILDDGQVVDQVRFPPEQIHADPVAPVRWLRERGRFDLIAGPSGYGLPLVLASECTEAQLALMSLMRRDERNTMQGVAGFSGLVRAFRDSGLPVVFLPGVIHLPTVPVHRKFNRIDLGTADKLCVAALATDLGRKVCVVELGTAFTACLVVNDGQIVDGVGGTSGPMGWQSAGAWDGEVAYLLSPLSKGDLFAGGAESIPGENVRREAYCESLVKAVAGLHAIAGGFDVVVLSGRLLESYDVLRDEIFAGLKRFGEVRTMPSLAGAWVKHAAQGAALIADGLAGGRAAERVDRLRIREAQGTVLDWLIHRPERI